MDGTPPYIELHCHSAYSFLDGASSPTDLAETAAKLGYPALALTDHDGVWGSMEFAKVSAETGIRAITGTELSVVMPGGRDDAGANHQVVTGAGVGANRESDGGDDDRPDIRHLTLLAEDRRGYANLCRLITKAHAGSRDGPGRQLSPPRVDLTEVERHAEGLICLTGCARQGLLAGHWQPRRENPAGERLARRLLEAFGPANLRVELQRPYWRHDRARNARLTALARRLGVPTVATGNVHSHSRAQARLQDAFVAVRLGESLEAAEPRRRGNSSAVLARPEAMAARHADHPEAVAETLRLAERLTFRLDSDLGYSYPGAESTTGDRELAELCQARLGERYGTMPARLREAGARLEGELAVIAHLGLSGFFLLHHDLLELAREVAVEVRGTASARACMPPGRGRGSSVSSLVCYLTGLSHIDPLHARLNPGRFLNPEVTEPPDIDLDFPRDIREKLIPRIHERYGADRSALVAAFPTYHARGAVRDLGKALGLPPAEIERVARTVHFYGGMDEIRRGIGSAIGERRAATPRWRHLVQLCSRAIGLPRHASQHSGGMVISTRPLIDLCPVVPVAMEGRQIVQWEKDSCADAGFVKIDLLGLGMLSAVERCVEEIERTRGEHVDLSRIPLDDPRTYDSICRAETTGVFQIESRAQMQLLTQTQPRSIEDLTVQVALVRPGPIQGGAVHPYVERYRAWRADPEGYEIPYEHPDLEPVLRETFGTIIYQDQVIEVAQALAGFSVGEGESLRRALSRKRSAKAIRRHHSRFLAGAAARGVTREAAERVFQQILGFAGFGFPKSHSAAFGLLAYQSAWLREHYGPEYLAALLNEQPMGFYPSDALIHEAQLRGIEVLPPDVNHSRLLCRVESDSPGSGTDNPVRIGLAYVKGLDRHAAEELVQERLHGGAYTGIGDLRSRSGCRRTELETLAWAGALRSLEKSRRDSLWRLGLAAGAVRVPKGTQLALPLDAGENPELEPLEPWDEVIADYETTSLSMARHPMELQRDDLPANVCPSHHLSTFEPGCTIVVAGLVIARQRPETANGIVFILLEDEHGTINLVVMPQVLDRFRTEVQTAPMLLAEGILEHREGNFSVKVKSLHALGRPDLHAATPAIQSFGRRGR